MEIKMNIDFKINSENRAQMEIKIQDAKQSKTVFHSKGISDVLPIEKIKNYEDACNGQLQAMAADMLQSDGLFTQIENLLRK